MDGVSAAASVIAVVGFALTSTKVIRDTISGIKDAPKIVQQTISALEELKKILQRVETLNERFEDVNADLQTLLQQCATDLKAFEKKIGCLRIMPTEKRFGKAWMRVKTMLKQDDLQRIWEGINRHVLALTMHFQLIGTEFSLTHANQLQRLDETHRAASLHTTRIKDGLAGARADSAAWHATTHQRIEELSSGVDALSNVSTGQSRKIEEMLGQLQDLIATNSNQGTRIWEVPETSENDRTSAANQKEEFEEDLRASLARLRGLALEKEKSFYSKAAEDIIGDIEQLLNTVSSVTETSTSKRNGKKRKRNKDQNIDSDLSSDEELQHRGIKRIEKLLGTTQCLVVNPQTRSRPIRTPGRKYKRRFLRRSHSVGDGSIAINVRSRMLKHIMNDPKDHEDYKGPDSEVFEVFEGEITFLPNSVPNTRISVSFEQRSTYQGSLLGKPTISFSATLPDNSEVFLRIKDGDMEGLLQLLARGTASLTDRDSMGRSLLNYAMLSLAPNICKYLVENGADVDAIEKGSDGDYLVSMLDLGSANDNEMASNELSWTLACRRILLEADADPTLSQHSHFDGALEIGTVESLRLVLDLGQEFIDLEEKDEYGCSALMRLIELNSHSTKPVALLLRRGADPNSCNNHGLSSLHFCIRYLKLDSCLDELILLINAGVDVHAVDYDGESITSYAYQTPVETGWEYRRTINSIGNRGYIWKNPWTTIRSGNRGNIWEEALTACGYDAAAFRQAYLDTGGRIRGKHGRWELDSDWEEASAVSDETSDDSEAEQEGEDFTEFEEERQSYDQGQNSNAEIHSYLEPSTFAQEQIDYQHPENTQFVYPPIQVPLESTEIWQSEPSTTGFVTELSQDEDSQTSLNTTFLPVQPTFTVDANLDPWTWSHTSQNHSKVSQYPMASFPYYEDQQPQLDTVQWGYNSTPHQSGIQLPQPWLQTPDYDMLEEDTNIWRQ